MSSAWGDSFGPSGTGTGLTIFASQTTMVSATKKFSGGSKTQRAAQIAKPMASLQQTKGSKASYLFADRNEQIVITDTNESWLVERIQHRT